MKKAVSEFISREWLNVLESVGQALIIVGDEGAIEFMNEQAAELMGQSAALAMGGAAGEVLAANPWIADLVRDPRARSRHALHLDGKIADRQGRSIPVHAAATPLVEDDGAHVGTLLTLQNLTHQRELEARAREADRLTELETLVAGLAHEIRNPLSGMRGAAQLLAGRPDSPEKVEQCTQIMVEEIDRLDGLMAQLLELSGRPRGPAVPVNVHRLLDRVLAIEDAGTNAHRFTRNFDPSLPPVSGDPDRLTQVLLNLVRNAVEATPEGGSITLTTRMETSYRVAGAGLDGRFLSVEISDQGAGISAENLDRIFSPFFTTKSGGTGLGLAISQRIVSEHGGALRARSDAESGSTFTVTLPVDPGTNHGA